MPGKLHVVVGAQYGSEGKGNVTGWLVKNSEYAISVRVGGPNAGHCVIGLDGEKYALQQLPVGVVCHPDSPIVIAEGSEIDPPTLLAELRRTAHFGSWRRLVIDPEATVIQPEHTTAPDGRPDSGRTGKGVGGARAARLRKTAPRWIDYVNAMEPGDPMWDLVMPMCYSTAAPLREALNYMDVIIEGTQGYGLGTHAGRYPHVTSGDCRAIDFLAQAGMTPREAGMAEVWLVARVHPIRIAGNSGPLFGEQTWEQVGVPAEYTTVTKKERRVGRWDADLVREAIEANGDPHLVLTFYDYIRPEEHGKEVVMRDIVLGTFEDSIGYGIGWVGTSDRTIAEVRQ